MATGIAQTWPDAFLRGYFLLSWEPVLFLYFRSGNKSSMYRLVQKQGLTKSSIYLGFRSNNNLC